jgi:hypothetical protein
MRDEDVSALMQRGVAVEITVTPSAEPGIEQARPLLLHPFVGQHHSSSSARVAAIGSTGRGGMTKVWGFAST